MKKNWFDSKVKEFSSIGGYQKPELNENSLKLDSNENYVLSKQFQNDIVSELGKILMLEIPSWWSENIK